MADTMSTADATKGATARNSRRTREEIVAAAVRRLVRGQEPTMRAVAAEAGVGERTIYRYFPSRDALEAAVRDAVAPRLGVPLCTSVDGLEDYVDELFGLFEANRELAVAVVTSTWTQATLAGTRSQNLRDLTALLRDACPGADPADLAAAAASLRTILSGAGWVYQRHGCGLSAEQVTSNAKWLIRQLLGAISV